MEAFMHQFFSLLYSELSSPVFLSRLQFSLSVIIHFIFPPLTIGLSLLVAFFETCYAASGKEHYRRMTKFWGRLFLINFAIGVVTGIVMEFQFGMNWSLFSSYVGDVFGVPLAIEVLLAFFLESTFIGLWIFGWEKFGKKTHAVIMWLVAIGSSLSAFWILTANSFMQEPVGYVLRNNRLELNNFTALFTSKQFVLEFWHTWFAAVVTAAFFIIAISAYHIMRKNDLKVFKLSFKIAVVYGLIGIIGVAYMGHRMADHIVKTQPMKMAAMESLWESENPASEAIIAFPDQIGKKNFYALRIPHGLDLLAYGKWTGRVAGINEIQKEYEAKYGPGDYIPPVAVTFYAFRAMVGVGMLLLIIAIYLFFKTVIRNNFKFNKWVMRGLMVCIIFPYIANITGWIVTEVGRQPWIVHGLMKTSQAMSPNLTWGDIATSLIAIFVVYTTLTIVAIFLLWRYAVLGTWDFQIKKINSEEE